MQISDTCFRKIIATVDQHMIDKDHVLLVVASSCLQQLYTHLKPFTLLSSAKIQATKYFVYFDLDGKYCMIGNEFLIPQQKGQLILTEKKLESTVSDMTGSGINRIKRSFDYDGTRYRSVLFPAFDDVREGCFSLLFNQELSLAQYPHLVDMVNSYQYPMNEEMDARRRVFMYSLRELVNFIAAKSEEQPTKNYTKSREVYDMYRMSNETVDDLRRVIEGYYRTEKINPTTNVTKWKYGGSSAEEWFGIPKTMTEDQMITIVYRTLRQVDPSCETTEDEVRQAFQKKEEYDDGVLTIRDRDGYELIGVEYNTIDPTRVRVSIPHKDERFSGQKPMDIVFH